MADIYRKSKDNRTIRDAFSRNTVAYSKNEGFRRTIYRLKLVKHHLLTLSVSRATIDRVNDARFYELW